MTSFLLNRRNFLISACSLAAAPLLTPASFAAAPGDKRFVTILLRGAMDGLYLLDFQPAYAIASNATVAILYNIAV